MYRLFQIQNWYTAFLVELTVKRTDLTYTALSPFTFIQPPVVK